MLESWLNIWPSDVNNWLVPTEKARMISSYFLSFFALIRNYFSQNFEMHVAFFQVCVTFNHFEQPNSPFILSCLAWDNIGTVLDHT